MMKHRATSTELQGSRYEESSMGGLQESKCRRANAGGQHGARVMGQRVDISWGWWGGGSCSGGGEAWRRREASGWLGESRPRARAQGPEPTKACGSLLLPGSGNSGMVTERGMGMGSGDFSA